jgi:hypothetical protein
MRIAPRALGAAAVVALVVALAGCGSTDDGSSPTTTTTGPSIPPSTTTGTATTTSLPSEPALSIAVWPTADSDVRYRTPVSAARAFAVEYLHFVAPYVGAFRPGDSRSGEVPIRATTEGTSTGPVTTVLVRQIDGSWWVLGSATPNLRLIEPAALEEIATPIRLRGMSTAFEATVNVSIRQDDLAEPLVEGTVMGGSNGRMGPFDASFDFEAPTSPAGAIVLSTISAANGQIAEAAVTRVRFAPT